MRVDLILLAVSLAASLPFEKTENTIQVGVREVHIEKEGLRAKRGTQMSMKKKFEIELKGEIVTLDLTLNEFVNSDAPTYVVEGDELRKWEQEKTDERLVKMFTSGQENCDTYIDDIIIFDDTCENHLETNRKFFDRLRDGSRSLIKAMSCLQLDGKIPLE